MSNSPTGSMVGLDAGIASQPCQTARCLSPSTASKPIRPNWQAPTPVEQKGPFSSNWKKQKAKIQRLHSHIANTRRDYLSQGHNDYQQNHAMILIEDEGCQHVKISSGTTRQPGRNVRSKIRLNRSILIRAGFELQLPA